jgi:hypothetical protein
MRTMDGGSASITARGVTLRLARNILDHGARIVGHIRLEIGEIGAQHVQLPS